MKIFNLAFLISLSALISIGLTGCGSYGWYPFLYHPTFSQGNYINPNAVDALKIGMTKAQVKNMMGDPILDTPLSPNTWHYVYTLRQKDKVVQHKQITLYFSRDRLVQVVR